LQFDAAGFGLTRQRRLASSATLPEQRLQIQVDSSNLHLPLRVAGGSLAFVDVDHALAIAIERALSSIKQALSIGSAVSYLLQVELLEARAEQTGDRIVVELVARVTLRTKSGNVYVAQTHSHARNAGAMDARTPRTPSASVTESIASQLQGWISDALPK